MKLDVFDIKGNKVDTIELSKGLSQFKPNLEVLAQYIRVFRANQRQGTSSTKNRAEVAGSGIKPWKQKGTGRARVGSKRNPLWRHGGISHGPKPKDWSLEMPKKMRKLALVTALFKYLKDGNLKVLDKLELASPKTKEVSMVKKNLDLVGKTLIVTNEDNKNLLKSVRNISKVSLVNVNNINAFDVISADNLLFFKDAVMILKGKYETK